MAPPTPGRVTRSSRAAGKGGTSSNNSVSSQEKDTMKESSSGALKEPPVVATGTEANQGQEEVLEESAYHDDNDNEDMLSPLGAVQTRTRSARKKRKLQEEQPEESTRSQQEKGDSSAKQMEEVEEESSEDIQHDEDSDSKPPAAKRARTSSPHPATTKETVLEDETTEDVEMTVPRTEAEEIPQVAEVGEVVVQGMEEDAKMPAVSVAEKEGTEISPAAVAASTETDAAMEGGAGATEAASGAWSETGPPLVERLRIPSHHTPGKNLSRAVPPSLQQDLDKLGVNASAAIDEGTNRRLQSTAARMPTRVLDYGTTAKITTTTMTSIATDESATVGTTLITSQVTDMVKGTSTTLEGSRKPDVSTPEEPTSDEERRRQQQRRREWVAAQLQRTLVWVMLLGLLQVVFYPIWIHPILSTVVRSSDGLLGLYRWKTRRTLPPNVRSDQAGWYTEQLHILRNAQQDLVQKKDELEYEMGRYREERKILSEELRKEQMRLQYESERWNRATRAARIYPIGEDADMSPEAVAALDISTLQALLRSSNGNFGDEGNDDDVEVDDAILDVSFLASWKLPPLSEVTCSAAPTDHTASSASVTKNLLEEALQGKVEELRNLAAASTEQIKANSTIEAVYRTWIQDTVLGLNLDEEERDDSNDLASEYESILLQKKQSLSKPSKVPKVEGASKDAIDKLIAARLEMERADQTGRIDYASILNGAVVIRNAGDRSTSPSLADGLPLVNRLLQLWSLRNYGLGPEAALTPIHPPLTLGHCWAFQREEGNKNSAYATLTFRLAKSIVVQTLSIEHPPQELTDRLQSAVRQFRVVGFEDSNAQGLPWPLGSFEFQLGGDIRQEFKLNDKVRGEDVPELQSISLLIDSNWGGEYSCLYRVRVFGKEN